MADSRLKCTNIRFPLALRGSTPHPAGGAYRSSRPLTVFEGILLSEERGREGTKGKGRKGKGEGRGDEVEKNWCGATYARPLAGFKGAASRRVAKEKGGERNGNE